jgi:hypothetical protein
MIQADLLRQAIVEKGTPQEPLVFFRTGMADMQASMAVNADVAVGIQQVDHGHLTQAVHGYDTLGIHFPFLVGTLQRLGLRLGQILMAFIATHFLLLFQIGGDPCSTGNLQAAQTRVFRYLQPQRLWTPAGVLVAQFQDGLLHLLGHCGQRSTGWPAHNGGQASATFLPIPLPPFADGRDGPSQFLGNFTATSPSLHLLGDSNALFQGCDSSFVAHRILPALIWQVSNTTL